MKAIRGSYGNVSFIVKKLKCSRSTIYEWFEKHDDLKEALKYEREEIIDLAENSLVKNVKKGREQSIALVLKTLGKDRGYIEKTQTEHKFDFSNVKMKELTDEQLEKLQLLLSKGVPEREAFILIGVVSA